MNQFRKRENGTLVSEAYIRGDFDGGLPEVLDVGTLNALGYDPILESVQPTPAYGQLAAPDGVEQIGEYWFYKWKLVDIDPATFADTKLADQKRVWGLIKDRRDTLKFGGVQLSVGDELYWFWTDSDNRAQYALLLDSARRNNLPGDFVLDSWKTMSGEFVPFTVQTLWNVVDQGIVKEKALFALCESKRQAMLQADNPNTFDWQSGWPQTYLEWAAEQAPVVGKPAPDLD